MNLADSSRTKFVVENGSLQDRSAIARLLEKASLPVPTAEEDVSFLVARIGATVCGCLGWEHYGQVVLLRSLAVAPDWRNQGVASQLVQTALDELKVQGVCEFYLLTETAAAFAERFGFRLTERSSLPSQLQRSTQVKTGCCSSAKCLQLKG